MRGPQADYSFGSCRRSVRGLPHGSGTWYDSGVMGKAIAVLFLMVVCSFSFVLLHLWLRKPAGAAETPRAAPALLETREDGSLYSVRLRLQECARRLMDWGRRAVSLKGELDAMRKDRDQLQGQVDDLQDDVRRLRRQIAASKPAAP